MINIKENLELNTLNHSCAHLMAQAIKHLYPQAKFWVGPVIDDGFYYDMDLNGAVIKEEDFEKIEKEMKKISKDGKRIVRIEISKQEALEMFKDDEYKIDLINNLPDDQVISAYKQGDYIDLCRGPHVESVKEIKYFKLLKASGAYYKGDCNNKMLQRVYGVCFKTQEDLDKQLYLIEEARKRDHRKLGKELELFMFDESAPGMPYMLPKGLVIYNTLVDFWRKEHNENGYLEFSAPMLNMSSLWKTSGHWDHYKEDMFVMEDADGATQALKPMSCPNAIMVYKNKIRSYKDLPLRFCDVDAIHRNEGSASLHGLLRVRVFHQDDSHNFIRQDQIFDEITSILKMAHHFYNIFGLTFTPYLSTRPDDFMGDIEKWDDAEAKLMEVLDKNFGHDGWVLNPKDGAFYGPKIDLKMQDALGREWQMGTIQLDYQLPERFDITYVDSDGSKVRPVMVHRTIYGSLERFIGLLIEQFAGHFPLWIAPRQVSVLPVNNEYHLQYAKKVYDELKKAGIRVELDDREEKLGYRIRDNQIKKVNYQVVVGDQERDNETVKVRKFDAQEQTTYTLNEFVALLKNEIETKAR
ncbi:MAG: threonine--tRNA ligase [Erysipelotrichaceae bacterium]|nr:threonine--tRNA ligase [Erysipelotrichaceae bacterium]